MPATIQQVLAHLERHETDPECGWITANDLRSAFSDLYAAAMSCCAQNSFQVETSQVPGEVPDPADPGAPGDIFINEPDGTVWIADDQGKWIGFSGPTGPPGPQGDGIHLKGHVADLAAANALPGPHSEGDSYLTDLGELLVWDGTQFQNVGVLQGPPGLDGQPGLDGAVGPAGDDGRSISTGSGDPNGPPAVQGNPDDLYIDHSTGDLWQMQTGGAWSHISSLMGAAGPAGPAGAAGATIRGGTTGPVPGDGNDGDWWVDTAAGNIYGPKAAGVWPAAISIMGPAGPAAVFDSATATGLAEGSNPTATVAAAANPGHWTLALGIPAGHTPRVYHGSNADDPITSPPGGAAPQTGDLFVRGGSAAASSPLGELWRYNGTTWVRANQNIRGPMGPAIAVLGPITTAGGWPTTRPGGGALQGGDAFIIESLPTGAPNPATGGVYAVGDFAFWDGTDWHNGGEIVGPAGPAGANGADGSSWLSGVGAPQPANGVDGDFYIDTQSGLLYGPKAGGAWPTDANDVMLLPQPHQAPGLIPQPGQVLGWVAGQGPVPAHNAYVDLPAGLPDQTGHSQGDVLQLGAPAGAGQPPTVGWGTPNTVPPPTAADQILVAAESVPGSGNFDTWVPGTAPQASNVWYINYGSTATTAREVNGVAVPAGDMVIWMGDTVDPTNAVAQDIIQRTDLTAP